MTTIIDYEFDTTDAVISSGFNESFGWRIQAGNSAIGLYVLSITWKIGKVGSPTGTMYCRIRDVNNVIVSEASLDISTLTGTRTVTKFTFPSAHQLASNDKLLLEYAGGDGSNYLDVSQSTSVSHAFPSNWIGSKSVALATWSDDSINGMYILCLSYNLENISDSSAFVDSIVKMVGKYITDSISISDTVKKSINKAISDTLSLTDSVHANRQSIAISDSIFITDTVSMSKAIVKNVIDSLSAGDSTSKSIAKKISDSESFSDTLSKNTIKSLSDGINLIDSISKGIVKLIQENPTITDSTSISKTIVKQIAESLTILDSVTLSRAITQNIIDNLSSGDNISKSFGKSISDNPQLIEQLAKAISKILTDNISIPDSTTQKIGSLLLTQIRQIKYNNPTKKLMSEGKPRIVSI